VAIDADGIAKEQDNSRGMNMVMAGAASVFMDLEFEKLKDGIRFLFGRKGEEVVQANIKTLEAGRDYAREQST
jgi:indolepyruvate ferredoxin oxidoreductase beta subunit